MTLAELEMTLPNGFHDSYLKSLSVDYERGELTLELELLVGGPDAVSVEDRERMIGATVKVNGLQFCIVDPPDSGTQSYSAIDGFVPSAANWEKSQGFPAVAEGYWIHSLFCFNWNSGIHIAGQSAILELLDPDDRRYLEVS